MKKTISLLLSALIFIGIASNAPEGAAAPEISVSAKACVLIDAQTAKVIYSKNSDQKLPMASTTKIMTALLTLESGELDEEFIVDSDAIRVEGSSMGLCFGDAVTKRTLCCGMLLPSGNDAANAAAVRIAGSLPLFADMMNARAAQIGMFSTCFVTPSGLHDERHASTAFDLALLTRTAMQNPDFRQICSESSMTISFGSPSIPRTLYNTNKLLGMRESVIGVKTGFTDEAGRCLVSCASEKGIELICVTLNAPDDWNDHQKLYDYGFGRVSKSTANAPALSVAAVGGERGTLSLCVTQPPDICAVEGSSNEITYIVRVPPFVYAPVEKGRTIGSLEYYIDGRLVASSALTSAENLASG